MISFTRGNTSNVSMQNTFENFTILVGGGNPGAVGLEFFANNTGAIRNVTIRSLDLDRSGHAGLNLRWIFRAGERMLTDTEVNALLKRGGQPVDPGQEKLCVLARGRGRLAAAVGDVHVLAEHVPVDPRRERVARVRA